MFNAKIEIVVVKGMIVRGRACGRFEVIGQREILGVQHYRLREINEAGVPHPTRGSVLLTRDAICPE